MSNSNTHDWCLMPLTSMGESLRTYKNLGLDCPDISSLEKSSHIGFFYCTKANKVEPLVDTNHVNLLLKRYGAFMDLEEFVLKHCWYRPGERIQFDETTRNLNTRYGEALGTISFVDKLNKNMKIKWDCNTFGEAAPLLHNRLMKAPSSKS